MRRFSVLFRSDDALVCADFQDFDGFQREQWDGSQWISDPGIDGNYYGAMSGGVTNCPQGATCGSIYRRSAGKMTTVYSFCQETGCPDGENPGGLVLGMDGKLYGETFGGGANGGGTFFRMTLSGKLTTIASFCAPSVCGYNTAPSLSVQGPDGSFYGVAEFGGAYGYGSIT